MMIETMSAAQCNDTELVVESLSGHREAFGQIVERYQSLVCSLAYNATGSLSQSQDLAQETFVLAWQLLPQLREPAKLRSWLCGIARNLIGKTLRQERRQPIHGAEPLESLGQFSSPEPVPLEHTISKEEENILWRSLERIPELYREPLVLFYREGQSIEQVATNLELSEDAVKQRLSRGRKLLTEEVTAFVEGALKRTNPGRAFTLGVLAALPVGTTSAKAAVVAATVAKGSAAAKGAAWMALLNVILGPFLMFFGTYLGYKLDHDSARSPQTRELTNKYYRILVACIAVFALAVLTLTLLGRGWLNARPALYAGVLIGLATTYLVFIAALMLWMRRCQRKLRLQEIVQENSETRRQETGFRLVPLFEYRSKISLLGLPLVHIRLRAGLDRGPVKAWIAGGDAAIGVIFAFGACAIAPVSVGGFAIGLLALGGCALGLAPFGGFSFGPWAMGGFAVGWQAYGGCAVGWSAAQGGVAVAHDFSSGAVALAQHANDDAARAFFASSEFFQKVPVVLGFAGCLNLMWLVPLVLLWKQRRNNEKQSHQRGQAQS